MTKDNCIFCQIVRGDAPAKILSDGINCIEIVPLDPVVEGHSIIIPRRHVADAMDDPSTTAVAMYDAAQWTKDRSFRDAKYKSVNFITSVGRPATQSVFHLHIHIVPRAVNDGLALPWYSGKSRH